ncbi:MAG: hypothetical protein M1831_000236 [Alyxoria varia]|nr:MAG: hypothetical protein M1831_000236 [Alyxoria varia]
MAKANGNGANVQGNSNNPYFPVIYKHLSKQKPLGDSTASASAVPGSGVTKSDFSRTDSSTDSLFYAEPRFVTHIDDGAISALMDYYGSVLPMSATSSGSSQEGIDDRRKPNNSSNSSLENPSLSPPRVLDLCSSWISHYPSTVENAASRGLIQVFGLGMNKAELQKNKVLDSGGRMIWDLNEKPDLQAAMSSLLTQTGLFLGGQHSQKDQTFLTDAHKLTATTCTVSIDYLVKPVDVLSSLRSITKPGGSVHLAISNRCFPTKAVSRWLRADETKRLRMCCEDLTSAGWKEIEVVEVTDGKPKGSETAGAEGNAGTIMRMVGLQGVFGQGDPLWVVRGRKVEADGAEWRDGKVEKGRMSSS